MTYLVSTFYKFVPLTHLEERQARWLSLGNQHQLRGTILLAKEGINATLSGSVEAVRGLIDEIQQDVEIGSLVVKESWSQDWPFGRFKIKLKQEIVTLGHPEISPIHQVGTYVPPQDWNQLLQDPDVTVIDTRNFYEVAIGTFQGAINPQTRSFREFPAYVQGQLDPQQHRKVAMFCTGGIRCEKATALLLSQGFSEVYHLQGGILNYLAEVPPEESLWQGECFVFDQRVSLQEGLAEGHYQMCPACGHPLSRENPDTATGLAAIKCPHCGQGPWPELAVGQ
ncbi:rhodanese-related sulfurtransferase [Synechocystis sp. LKSZ1]|uniref:oxygen-dependent tRNA uridine(34) hydroxylase TrhO n=1 Tax=Synechocystis sp. LKSZ1 TaxID=3144951 RepID=UPI00336BC985